MLRFPLRSLVVESGKTSKLFSQPRVWNLNLDQIESGTGRVFSKQMVSADELGPSTYYFEAGTVLYSKLRPYLNKVVVADDDGFATTELVPLRCLRDKCLPEYLAHFLRSEEFMKFARTVVAGAKMPRMVMEEFWEYSVPLPSVSEQHRIVAILDHAGALRTKRREALRQLDEFQQAMFIEMFGDARENDRGWSMAAIESFVSDMKGGASLAPDDFIEEGFPILHKGAIKPNGDIQLDSKKKTYVASEYALARPRCIVSRDYVAVTLRDLVPSGPSIGLAVDLQTGPFDKYILAQGAYAFRINEEIMTREFFVQLSNMPTFRYVLKQYAVGSTQIHIRTPIYLGIKVPVPPIKLQQEFSKRIRAARTMREAFEKSAAGFNDLFTSLQHRAFRGDL